MLGLQLNHVSKRGPWRFQMHFRQQNSLDLDCYFNDIVRKGPIKHARIGSGKGLALKCRQTISWHKTDKDPCDATSATNKMNF